MSSWARPINFYLAGVVVLWRWGSMGKCFRGITFEGIQKYWDMDTKKYVSPLKLVKDKFNIWQIHRQVWQIYPRKTPLCPPPHSPLSPHPAKCRFASLLFVVFFDRMMICSNIYSSRRRNPCTRRGCFVCTNRRKERVVWDKLDEDLEVKVTDKGRSVFAKRSFGLGEIVAEYKGEFISPEQFKDKAEEAESSGNCFFFEFLFRGKKYAIDARQEDETKGRLINHSKKFPNVKPIVDSCLKKGNPVLFFKAIREVEKGTELLYDYQERRKAVIQKYPWLLEWINHLVQWKLHYIISRDVYLIPTPFKTDESAFISSAWFITNAGLTAGEIWLPGAFNWQRRVKIVKPGAWTSNSSCLAVRALLWKPTGHNSASPGYVLHGYRVGRGTFERKSTIFKAAFRFSCSSRSNVDPNHGRFHRFVRQRNEFMTDSQCESTFNRFWDNDAQSPDRSNSVLPAHIPSSARNREQVTDFAKGRNRDDFPEYQILHNPSPLVCVDNEVNKRSTASHSVISGKDTGDAKFSGFGDCVNFPFNRYRTNDDISTESLFSWEPFRQYCYWTDLFLVDIEIYGQIKVGILETFVDWFACDSSLTA